MCPVQCLPAILTCEAWQGGQEGPRLHVRGCGQLAGLGPAWKFHLPKVGQCELPRGEPFTALG